MNKPTQNDWSNEADLDVVREVDEVIAMMKITMSKSRCFERSI